MRHIMVASCLGVLALSSIGLNAGAQENAGRYLNERVAAPVDALELKFASGYTQGFGNLAPSRGVDKVAGPGLGVSADIDYRMNPDWSFGLEMQYQEFASANNSSSRGFVSNLGATYHFLPVFRGDPSIRAGVGYRAVWENNPFGFQAGPTVRQGIELLTMKAAYDVRVSEDVSIAPFFGADLNLFAWQSPAASNSMSGQVATFLYTGLQGRFDLGGTRDDRVVRAAELPTGVTEQQPQPTERVSPGIAVSPDLLQECKLSLDASPKFDFDKSELQPEDLAVLDKIAACFTTGPLKDSSMRLVGRCDPRGTIEYNDALGMRRATEVSNYLEKDGVDAARIEKVSRGKLDATGTDEATWAVDRRVDILQRQ
jgi:peptidoglycan-associated lipoprotein